MVGRPAAVPLFEKVLAAGFAKRSQGNSLSPLLAYDTGGRLYVAGSDCRLRSADVRQHLLSGVWAQSAGASVDWGRTPVRVLELSEKVDFTITDCSVSRSGVYAVLVGYENQDAETAVVKVVDLTSARPAPEGGPSMCQSFAVHDELFSTHPGLRVLQASWHPGSDVHLAVLTSDSTWRLYSVHDLCLPEQSFELQLVRKRSLGLGGEPGRRVVAFAFGALCNWQRFTVYFSTSDGAIYTLCPVAPFGSWVAASAIEQLTPAAADGDNDVATPNTSAWLQQAFPQPQAQGCQGAGSLKAAPHALAEHVPALVGPLPLCSVSDEAASLADLLGPHHPATALAALRCGNSCSAVAVGTATGRVGVCVVAEELAPQWQERSPQCMLAGDTLVAIRVQVAVDGTAPPALLLIDLIDLQVPSRASEDAEDDAGARSLQLLPDPGAPERLFAVHSAGAFAIRLPWLPVLARVLADTAEAGKEAVLEELPDLPPSAVEELRAGATAGGVVVGDALTGSALLVLAADGAPHCLWPKRQSAGLDEQRVDPAAPHTQPRSPQGDVEARLEQVYGEVLGGPRPLSLPRSRSPTGAGSPGGQRLLHDCINLLREKHVEFAHQAHHDLVRRIEQLPKESASQAEKGQWVLAAIKAAHHASEGLASRVERAAALQSNLTARLGLLADLQWSLPHPLSSAEVAFRDAELPSLQSFHKQLQQDLRALRARLEALHPSGQENGQRKAALAAMPSPVAQGQLSASQLRRVRQAIEEQSSLISMNLAKLQVLEDLTAQKLL